MKLTNKQRLEFASQIEGKKKAVELLKFEQITNKVSEDEMRARIFYAEAGALAAFDALFALGFIVEKPTEKVLESLNK